MIQQTTANRLIYKPRHDNLLLDLSTRNDLSDHFHFQAEKKKRRKRVTETEKKTSKDASFKDPSELSRATNKDQDKVGADGRFELFRRVQLVSFFISDAPHSLAVLIMISLFFVPFSSSRFAAKIRL
jgi:hypothetical protein